MNDREAIQETLGYLYEATGIAALGPLMCCQSCARAELEADPPEGAIPGMYAFWHDQTDDDAFDENGNLEGILYIYHEGEGVADKVVEWLRSEGFDALWNGNDDTAIMVQAEEE